jgi:Ni/Co efflux regulator RcnB
MQRFIFHKSLVLALICAGIFLTGTALAEKPDWAGDKKKKKQKQEERSSDHNVNRAPDQANASNKDDRGDSGDRRGRDIRESKYFSKQKQVSIHHYYSDEYRKGHCPPGLYKKGKHCVPPGHARRWERGRSLPKEVIFYDLPPAILIQLGPAPPRHRFVRVAQDILLIAVGTGMVVDAIEDIGRVFD